MFTTYPVSMNFTWFYFLRGRAPSIPAPAISPETNVATYVLTGRPRPISDPMGWLKSKPGYWVARSALGRGQYEADISEIKQRCIAACRFLESRGKLI